MRIGKVKNGAITLKEGQKIIISVGNFIGDEKKIPTDLKTITKDAKKGQSILLDDGNLEFKIEKISGDDVHCEVIYGGELKDHKGMNLPGTN
ncbi:MAG: hypothetical protein IPM57_03005 [Oligoflexia bacterium]|nr:hypothetical protein [Oligoflexia bacterium]